LFKSEEINELLEKKFIGGVNKGLDEDVVGVIIYHLRKEFEVEEPRQHLSGSSVRHSHKN
jgi:hypothetical protein